MRYTADLTVTAVNNPLWRQWLVRAREAHAIAELWGKPRNHPGESLAITWGKPRNHPGECPAITLGHP
jgi:hypothetical protein